MEMMEEPLPPGYKARDRSLSKPSVKSKHISRPYALNSRNESKKGDFNSNFNPDFCARCQRLFQNCEEPALNLFENQTASFYAFWDFWYLEKSARLGCKLCLIVSRALQPAKFLLEGSEALPSRYDIGSYSGDFATHAIRFYFYHALENTSPLLLRQAPLITITLEPKESSYISDLSIGKCKFPRSLENSTTGSEAALGQIRKWINCCELNHSCQQSQREESFLPTRLIHIGSTEPSNPPMIVNREDIKPGSKYMTLSHCWGRPGPKVVLKEELLEAFEISLPMSELPATFAQAIKVTESLGVEYIWIDSLCIIQNQASHEDWLVEAPTMWKVYRNSYLNLSATASSHSEEGLFRERPEYTVDQCIATVGEGHPQFAAGEYTIYDDEEWMMYVDNGAVNTRAWVCQERLLAPRIVHFSEHQLFWECRELKASEMFSEGVPERYERGVENLLFSKLPSSDPRNLLEVWDSIVTTYTRTDLSFVSDKLIAVSALARQISDISDIAGEYLGGMWKNHLVGQLLWASTRQSSRASEYRAPSWSWASIDGAVSPNFDWSGYGRTKYAGRSLVKILGATVIPQFDSYSSAASGVLLLSGPLLKVNNLQTPESEKDKEIQHEKSETPEENNSHLTTMMQNLIPGYEGESLLSFDVSQGNNPQAVKLTFDPSHSIAAIDESGSRRMQRIGPGSKRHFEAKMSQDSADLWLDEDLDDGSQLKNQLYLLPVLCFSDIDHKFDREGREIESLDGMVLRPSKDGQFRRMGIFHVTEYGIADFLCEFGNQETSQLPVDEVLCDSLPLDQFLPERWNGKKLDFLPKALGCHRIRIV